MQPRDPLAKLEDTACWYTMLDENILFTQIGRSITKPFSKTGVVLTPCPGKTCSRANRTKKAVISVEHAHAA